jgi:hypothetical protein
MNSKLLAGLWGLVFPLFTLLWSCPSLPQSKGTLFERELFIPVPLWAWLLVITLGIGIRFYKLTSLSTWPMPDDGMSYFYSFELSQKWVWKLFETQTQTPCVFFDTLALFFKIFEPSLFSLWLFPALFSALTLLPIYVISRSFFPPSFGIILFTLAAFNFGFLYIGRFCQWPVLVLFWAALNLMVLSFWSRAAKGPSRNKWSLALGMVTGLGFFIAINWPVMAMAVVLAVIGYLRKGRFQTGEREWPFWIGLFLSSGLFALLAYQSGYGTHIQNLWAFHPGMDWARQLEDSFSNIAALFWEINPTLPHYGPVWGGVLNPLMTSCFFLGLTELWRHRYEPFSLWLILSFFLGLMPGLVTKNYDFFRDLAVLFPLLILAAWGLRALIFSIHLPQKKKLMVLGVMLACSSGMDVYHLTGPYHQTWGTPGPFWDGFKSSELYRAYQILDQTQKQMGRGAVLEDLRPAVTDRTLQVAVYSFDSCWNPVVPFSEVRWVAILINANYKPFLQKKFPQSEWHWLGKETIWNQPMMLAIIPTASPHVNILRDWFEGDRLYHPLVVQIENVLSRDDQLAVIKDLESLGSRLSPDPFLQSCLWEKIAFHRMSIHDGPGALQAVQEGLKKGYPLAHFYNLEGILLGHMGRTVEARQAFHKALLAPLNLTPAAENLQKLNQ